MSEDIKDQEEKEQTAETAEEVSEESEAASTEETTSEESAEESQEEVAEEETPADTDEPSDEATEESAEDEPAEEEPAEEVDPPVAAADEAAADEGDVMGMAAFFDHPHHLLYAAEEARDKKFERWDAYSPFPSHGMDQAMGLKRSWIPWVTFTAGITGTMTAAGLQFGIMGFDWPMVYGGKPFIAWPSFVPIMFELTVLFAGVTTGIVMLIAAGCFRRNHIIDPGISNDRFVLWISAEDPAFEAEEVKKFMLDLNPSEVRTVRKAGN